jgi:hypothetical protein
MKDKYEIDMDDQFNYTASYQDYKEKNSSTR